MIKNLYPWMLASVVLAAVLYWAVSTYNEMKYEQENVETAWSKLENQYGRRVNLVTDLINIVHDKAGQEQGALTDALMARSRVNQMVIDLSHATPVQLVEYQRAQLELDQSFAQLLAVAETYPNIQGDPAFADLKKQFADSESLVVRACQLFNEAAYSYNNIIRRFPNSMLAAMAGFEKRPYFETDEVYAPGQDF